MPPRPPPAMANEAACPSAPMRRLFVGGAAVPLLPDGRPAKAAPSVEAREAILARSSELEELGRRWQEIESRLFALHDWPRLTSAEQRRFPERQEMDELSDRMDTLEDENQLLLVSLPAIVATTPLGLCGKLAVAALQICPEDHPEAHQLIASVLRDYRMMLGR